MQHANPEEHQHDKQCRNHRDSQQFHRDVAFRAEHILRHRLALSAELFLYQSERSGNHAPVLDDTQQTRHSDGPDTNVTTVTGIEYLRVDVAHTRRSQQGQDDPPREERTTGDNGGVLKTDDIAQAQHGGTRIDRHHRLVFERDAFTPRSHTCGEALCPQTEGGDDKVVQSAHSRSPYKRFRLTAALLARHKHLRGRGSFRERVLAVLLLHEELAERNEE